ncbi:MAG: 50S ribosomal protein L5 [Thermoplasmata archaeon]
MNSMRQIRIEKVVVNIGVGEAGDKLLKAQKVLEMLAGQRAIQTLSKKTNRDWGIRKGMPIGTKVTLRGESAEKFLREALWARNNVLNGYNFDPEGNFSFGIVDYTDFKGMKYDPEIGLFGMDVNVVLQRAGYRIARRRIKRNRVPRRHRVNKEEAISFVKDRFQVEVR